MGALNPVRLEKIKERYEYFDDPVIPKFHYGSHALQRGNGEHTQQHCHRRRGRRASDLSSMHARAARPWGLLVRLLWRCG